MEVYSFEVLTLYVKRYNVIRKQTGINWQTPGQPLKKQNEELYLILTIKWCHKK